LTHGREKILLKDQQRVHNAINYVLENITAPLSIAEVAKQVYLSEFHFHRIFKSITNEPFNQFVRRKRLERAFHCLLRYNQPSISEVSENCGFSSSANFSKAFQAYFGFTPSQHRKATPGINSKNGKLFSKYGKEISPATTYNGSLSEQQSDVVKSKIIRIEVVKLADTHYCTIASTQGYAIEGINGAWENMREWLARHNIPMEAGKSAAFCFDNMWLTPEQMCRYEFAYVIDDIEWAKQSDVCVRTQKAGRYLAIEYSGKKSEMQQQMQQLYLWILSDYFANTHLNITYE
jgi:AraC family transcriptional regulator